MAPRNAMFQTGQYRNAMLDRPNAMSTADMLNVPIERGSILPLTRYLDRTEFDLTSGLPGAMYQAATLPGRTYQGQVPEDQMIPEAFNFAGNVMLGGLMSPKPSNALGIFGGRLAKTADHAALARAQEMAANGVPRDQIWNATGWFQGADKKWRFEIDDSGMSMRHPDAMPPGMAGRVTGAIDHPQLTDAYPHLNDVIYTNDPGLLSGAQGAHFVGREPDGNVLTAIGVHPQAKDMRSTMLHELQHSIQNAEGFSPGSRPTSFEKFQDYQNAPGEVEARSVQARKDLTERQRRARPPWMDYDVSDITQGSMLHQTQSPGVEGEAVRRHADR